MRVLTAATDEVTTATAPTATPRRRVPWDLVADAGAVVVLLALLVHTAGDDGGRPIPTLTWATIVAAIAALPLLARMQRLGRLTSLLVVGVAAGPVVSWAVAPYRAGGARPMLVAVAMVLAFLAARHLWARPWGPGVLAALVAAAVARAWYGAFLAWWGAGMGGGEPQWLALSWHNQSGTLMAVGAVACAAVALTDRRWVRNTALGLGSVTAAGCWLSGSRGAVLAAVIGVAVALVASRAVPRRRLLVTTAVLLVGTVLTVTGLTALAPSTDTPIAAREQTAEANLIARIGHADAAIRMAAAAPITGSGPGSYRWASRAVYPDDTNLTSSAHNEYAEAFGETGLVGGLPVAIAALAATGLALGRTRRRPEGTSPGSLRATTSAAAAGVVAALGLHAGADFDWDYALLAALLAVGVAILAGSRDRAPRAAGRCPTVALASTLVLAVGGASFVGLSHTVGGEVPWRYDDGAIAERIANGHLDEAATDLDRFEGWNPGAAATPVLRAALALRAGTGSLDGLAAAVDPQRQPTSVTAFAVDELIAHGALAEASDVLDHLEGFIDDRRAWGVADSAGDLGVRRLEVARATGGCTAVEELRPAIERRVATFGDYAVDHFAAVSAGLCPRG